MKLKTIVLLGYLFIAAITIILAITGIFFLNDLTSTTDKILKDNYKSIVAAQNMIDELNNMDNALLLYLSAPERKSEALGLFKNAEIKYYTNLDSCANNITEPGEKELVDTLGLLSKMYTKFADDIGNHDLNTYNSTISERYQHLKQKCYDLLNLNHKEMLLRRDNAIETSRKAGIFMIVISLLSLVIVIIAALRVPSLIIKPLSEFTEKVRAISDKKYSERIDIVSENELGILAGTFNKMASKLEEYDKSNIELLIAEKKRAEAIVKSMVDGIFVLNENYEILIVNNIGEELLGMFEESLKGKSAFEIAKRNNLVNNLIQGLDSETPSVSRVPNYLRIFYKGKEEFYLKETVKVTAEDKILGYIIILKNVTGFKELDEQKSGFVATVSHELRTPLSAMNMSLRLLRDETIGELNNEQKKIIESMKEEVKRLLEIVTELLNLSKIESGSDLLRIQHISVEELIDAALTPLLMQFEQKNIRINTNIENNLPELNIDANKIAWVLINLLNNALRYSLENSEIDINIKRNDGNILFSVKDYGTGIEPQHIGKIFDKFVQLGGKNIEKGLGLGLAISKEFVTAHKGNIWVKSEPGKDSEFFFTIPV